MSTALGHAHQNAQVAYQRDGACVVRGVVDARWLDRLRDNIARAMAEPGPYAERYGPEGDKRFFGDLDSSRRIPSLWDFVIHGPLGALAGEIMGSSTSTFFYDQVLVKEPGAQGRTPWHQDQPYWAVDGAQVCSVWLPLDPVAQEVSLAFVAGSHQWGQAYNPTKFADGAPYKDTGLPQLPDIDADPDAYNILAWEVEPGDCVVFNAMTVHGAPANPTASRRRVIATRWLGDDARYITRRGEVGYPPSPPGFQDGEPYTGPDYPLVWRQADGEANA